MSLARKIFEKSPGGLERAPACLLESHGRFLRWSRRARAGARMAHESPGRDFREHLESIPRALQSSWSPLRRSWQADDALSLRFPMFLGHRALRAYVCPCSGTFGRSGCTPALPNRPEASLDGPTVRGFLLIPGPGWGTCKEGLEGPLLLIQYTCYLILGTRHLILDTCTYTCTYTIPYTCTYTLYLYLYLIYLYSKWSSTAV